MKPLLPPKAPEFQDLLAYWARSRSDWFSHRPDFDRDFRVRFLALHEEARLGRLAEWEASPDGLLALLILLDQFPRNAFRGEPRMYDTDAQARRIARIGIDRGDLDKLAEDMRLFLILPLSHSEDLADHDLSVALHQKIVPDGLYRANRHREIIRRFGRFPHRNAILGRKSTKDEIRYLAEGGFRG